MNYSTVMQKLRKLSMSGSTLGLSRSKELEKRLGAPSSNYRCILVAGSNGKGSVATMLARGLEEKG
ncbi:MAG: bifunctional folylpolyglutamate synthase/dihydrofolate synthase, partial [Candidatus Micrarchaeia archaeon]